MIVFRADLQGNGSIRLADFHRTATARNAHGGHTGNGGNGGNGGAGGGAGGVHGGGAREEAAVVKVCDESGVMYSIPFSDIAPAPTSTTTSAATSIATTRFASTPCAADGRGRGGGGARAVGPAGDPRRRPAAHGGGDGEYLTMDARGQRGAAAGMFNPGYDLFV